MYERLICPYCSEWVDFDNSDMRTEDELYEVQCGSCEKLFGVRLSISWNYYEEKVDCWNGSEHKWRNRVSAPRKYAIGKQMCDMCGDQRTINKDEWEKIDANHSHPQNWRNS